MSTPSHVRVRVVDHIGRLTLDRPRALNALDLGMIRDLRNALDVWSTDSSVRAVVLDGAGDRGFCAGGDVRAVRQSILDREFDGIAAFFREEYELNALISEYPKPIVAFADGVTMGGGIGLAGHAQVRLVTERSVLAMPETGIGFTPDVGGSLLLARAPGRLGEYLALTGRTVNATDAIYAGLADRLIDSEAIPALIHEIGSGTDIDSAVRASTPTHQAPEGDLDGAREWVDEAFSASSVPEIIARLRVSDAPAAAETVTALERLSPTALTVTLESVRRARRVDSLRDVLAQEFRLAMWFATTQTDMPEGIRAVLVDRDRNPSWTPDSLLEVPASLVDAAFSFVPEQPGPGSADWRSA